PECQLSGFMDKIIDIKYTMLTSWEDNAIDAFLPVLEDYALSILLDRCDAARVFRVPIEAFHVLLSDLITFLLEDDDEDDSTESDGDE
ncbi:hypothetical protein, partial [Streptomyces brasiliscabiei]|uniref:hypothetical protein n=1 Tax=Streptomyces brasiliscabiei TaxID=2736302 RepID=UPI00301522E9